VWSLADTATVTVQGFMLGLHTTSKGWGLLLGHHRDFLMASCGDFLMARDTGLRPGVPRSESARLGPSESEASRATRS
jgi:hypothetical protein